MPDYTDLTAEHCALIIAQNKEYNYIYNAALQIVKEHKEKIEQLEHSIKDASDYMNQTLEELGLDK